MKSIKTLTQKYLNIRLSLTTLKKDVAKRFIDSFSDNFGIVPSYIANCNIAITCKFFCIQEIIIELNNKLNINSTYDSLLNVNKGFDSHT